MRKIARCTLTIASKMPLGPYEVLSYRRSATRVCEIVAKLSEDLTIHRKKLGLSSQDIANCLIAVQPLLAPHYKELDCDVEWQSVLNTFAICMSVDYE